MEYNKRIVGKNKKNIFNFYKKYKNKNSGLSIFERLNILNTKDKLLKMKNHDFMLLYCTKQNKDKIAYSLKEFVIYRYIFRKILKGYNIKFYTKINDYKINELDNNELIDTDNHVYIVQKQNIINKELFKNTETIDTSLPLNHKNVTEELSNYLNKKNLIVKIDNNNFYFTDITKDLDDNFKNNYMNKLITKGNVFYYINNNKNKKKLLGQSLLYKAKDANKKLDIFKTINVFQKMAIFIYFVIYFLVIIELRLLILFQNIKIILIK